MKYLFNTTRVKFLTSALLAGGGSLSAQYSPAAVFQGVIGKTLEDTKEWLPDQKKAVGFDYHYIFPATNDRVPCVYIEQNHIVNLDQQDTIQVNYAGNFPGEPTGADQPELLKMIPSHGHQNTIVNGVSRIGFMKGGKSARWIDEEMGSVFLGKALDFIRANKHHPFFLYYALHQPHVPRMPNASFAGKSGLGPRGDAILEADWCVGKLLDNLEKLGLDKNTLVIFSSDNGPVLDDGYQDDAVAKNGDHKPAGRFRGGKYRLYNGGTQIPFLIRWPGTIQSGVFMDKYQLFQVSRDAGQQLDLSDKFPEKVEELKNLLETVSGRILR